MEEIINQKTNQNEAGTKEEKKKKWGVGSYIMLALFLIIYLPQIENLRKDWIIFVEALLAGTISALLFYPVFNRTKIKNKQLKAIGTGLFLYIAVAIIVKLLMVMLAITAN